MGVTPHDSETLDHVCNHPYQAKSPQPYTWTEIRERIIWRNVLLLGFFHAGAAAAIIVYFFGLHPVPTHWATWIFGGFHFQITIMPDRTVYGHLPALGVTAGAHRLWTHRSYKANNKLKIMLMLIYCTFGMNSIFHWVKDHRVHHKYSETDADPHNAKRGFFFSHIGWLMLKRHPDYLAQGRMIDMSDIIADPVVMFQKKHITALTLIFCYAIPCAIPIIFWEETVINTIIIQCFLRYTISLNIIWSVNSVAHLWGDRPYNKFINPAENLFVCFVTAGEGSHNYHHTFPWDYKASELPYLKFNTTTIFIDAMAKLGWAYDMREPSPELVNNVIQRIGYKSGNNAAY